jgi:hypothetical protein
MFQDPEIENVQTAVRHKILWSEDSPEVSTEDGEVVFNPPKKEGQITQDMGRGDKIWSGDINIVESLHPEGIEGYISFLEDLARSDKPLRYFDQFGNEHIVKLKEPDFDYSTLPNKVTASIEIRQDNNPTDSQVN